MVHKIKLSKELLFIENILILKDVNSIYKSLADILKVNETIIRHFILQNHMFYKYVEDVSLEDFFKVIFNKIISTKDLYNKVKFDYITISHFTSRLNENDIEKQTLYNLFDAFIQDTDLSLYMGQNGFKFTKEKNSILTYYKDKKIDWKDYFKEGLKEGNPYRVQVRLVKGYKGINDKCVNGFLFGENLIENNYVKNILLGCPEIIGDICGVLGRKDMKQYIANNSFKYVITFKEKICNVVFDNGRKLNDKEKIDNIYINVILYLCKKFCGRWDENSNPIIRLKDELNVYSENIIEAKKVDAMF